jgi:hypothetical protein
MREFFFCWEAAAADRNQGVKILDRSVPPGPARCR